MPPTEGQMAMAKIEWLWRHFYTSSRIDLKYLRNSEFRSMIPSQFESAVFQITTMVAGERIKEIKYPLNWWQAFRERWFPKFVLDRWPVKYHTWKIDFLYPEIDKRSGMHPEIAIYDSQRSQGYPHYEDMPEYYDEEES